MKNKLFKRILTALVALLMLFSLLSVSVLAADEEAAEEKRAVDWTLENDGDVLINEDERISYFYYDPGISLCLIPENIYVYAENMGVGYYFPAEIESNLDFKEVVWLDDTYGYTFYATAAGREHMERFLQGEIGGIYLRHSVSNYARVNNSFVNSLNTLTDKKNFDVRYLKDFDFYELQAWDSTGTFSYVYGVVYQIYDEYWYLNYTELGNQYFDANGEFSYRRGEVSMKRVPSPLVDEMYAYCDNSDYRHTVYVYEASELESDIDLVEGYLVLFWIGYAVLGFIFPLPFLVIGLVLAFIKKLGKRKYWLAVSGSALLWLAVAIVLAVVLAVVILI